MYTTSIRPSRLVVNMGRKPPASSYPTKAMQTDHPVLANIPFEIKSIKTLTSLWAGYGRVLEIHGEDGQTYIAKLVEPPSHGSGISHNRKLHSYQVEAAFYTTAAPAIINHPDANHIPTPLHVECSLDSDQGGAMLLVMNDLRKEYPSRHGSFDHQHAKAVLTWLAAFHAQFWEPAERVEGVWDEGTYWHLATRLEELEEIGREWQDLKDCAHQIDSLLKTGSQTLLHGDAKAANIVFDDSDKNNPRCAVYDFQYTGYGDPMKDLAYLMCSSVSGAAIGKFENEMLQHYHTELTSRLQPKQAAAYSFEYMLERFELAVVDFVRFMAGWGMWGSSNWATTKTKNYLKRTAAS